MAKLTQDEKDAIRDAAVEQWWKDWFEEDYSWEGLADKPWQGWIYVDNLTAYDAMIEQYPQLLDGCPNTACQVIPASEIDILNANYKTATRPATLQDYWRDQQDRLEGQSGDEKRYTQAHLPQWHKDGTATWKNEINHQNWNKLRELLTQRMERGEYTNVNIDYINVVTVTGSDGRSQFRGCILPALPSQKTLRNQQQEIKLEDGLHISFYRAAFLQSQHFKNTIFASTTNFQNVKFSGDEVSFLRAEFPSGNVKFNNALFLRSSAYFYESHFSGGEADFRGAQFFEGAAFTNSLFSGGNAFFDNAKFLDGNVYFFATQFTNGNAYFRKVQFNGEYTTFLLAEAVKSVVFFDTKFDTQLNFQNMVFGSTASFIDATFPSSKHSQSAFRGAQFNGPVDFSRPTITDEDGNPLPDDDLHFPFNAFDHANIKDQLILTGRGDVYAQQEFDRALRSVEAACKSDETDTREDRYVALERGCTTLKKAMEASSDKTRAQRFFKFEMLARAKRPSTGPLTKFMTSIYGLTADYGGSLWRPLAALFISWLVFTLIYGVNGYFIGVTPTNPLSIFWGPIDLSAANIFRPLLIWSKAILPNDATWLDLYQDTLSPGGWLTIKLLATVQSFISITLIFLFGLATKRKFQIG